RALNSPIGAKDASREILIQEIEQEKAGLFSKNAKADEEQVAQTDVALLLELFENAKTVGSLVQVPSELATKLPKIEDRIANVLKAGDLTHAPAHLLHPLIKQAHLLASQYDAVVANPPYMGSKFYSPKLKAFVTGEYNAAKADLYSCFLQRNAAAVKSDGFVG